MTEEFGPTHADTEKYSKTTSQLHPKHINTRHRKLMRLLIAGWTVKDAGEYLGYHPKRISQIITSPLFKEEMAKMQNEVNKEFVENEAGRPYLREARLILEEATPAAAQLLVDVLKENVKVDIKDRQLSAKEILDRSGITGKQKVESDVTIAADECLINAITQSIKEMKSEKVSSLPISTSEGESGK